LAGTGILRNTPGIPVPQEFLQKIPVKSEKTGNTATPSKTTFQRKIPPEFAGRKKNPQESCQERFLGSKKKILKTGITNLGFLQDNNNNIISSLLKNI